MKLLDNHYTLLTLDFETYYGPKYSLSLQSMNTFKYVADEQFKLHSVGVKIDDEATQYYDFDDPAQLSEFKALLDALPEQTALLCHNTAFDGFILHYHFNWHPALYLDTASMSRGFFVGQKANLKHLSIRLFPNNPELRKLDDLAKTFGHRVVPDEVKPAFEAYCIRDVEMTKACFDVMIEHYPDDELRLIDWTLRCMCEPTLTVDAELVQEEIDYQVALKRDAIDASGISETILRSDKQFAEWLDDNGVIYEMKRNPKDELIPALSQSDWGWQRLVAHYPEHDAVFKARKHAKSSIQESRARWFKDVARWNHNRMPVPLKYYGADTGRWSGSEKLNLQNLPRISHDPNSGRLRRSLRAPEGEVIIVRDLSNIEGRMLAWEANEGYLLDLFKNDGCPYLFMAEAIYNAPHGSFTKQNNGGERNVGKVATLGLGYGMGHKKFWVTMNTGPMGMDPIPTSEQDAQRIVNIYRSTNANITRYWQACNDAIEMMATLGDNESRSFGPLELVRNAAILPNGMALQYPDLTGTPNQWNGYDFTFGNGKKVYGGLLCENITQALARIVISEQLLRIQAELDANYGRDVARIVHMVHDELLVVAPQALGDEIYTLMGDVMSQPPAWCSDLPLKSEGGLAVEYSK